MFKKRSISILTSLALVFPYSVFAAETPADFKSLVGLFLGLIDKLIYLIFAVTILVVVWGILRAFVIGGGDAKSVEAGKKVVSIGIITLVIMTSVWGILQLIKGSFDGTSESQKVEDTEKATPGQDAKTPSKNPFIGDTQTCIKDGKEIPLDNCVSSGGMVVWK